MILQIKITKHAIQHSAIVYQHQSASTKFFICKFFKLKFADICKKLQKWKYYINVQCEWWLEVWVQGAEPQNLSKIVL